LIVLDLTADTVNLRSKMSYVVYIKLGDFVILTVLLFVFMTSTCRYRTSNFS